MSNPVFRQNFIDNERILDSEPMTVNGSINKIFILLAILIATSFAVWNLSFQGFYDKASMLGGIGLIGSIITFIVIMFNKKSLPIAAPVYAGFEGFMIGGISALFERMYAGIVVQAVFATFIALFSMLVLYRIGAIRCTEKFRSVLMISTLSICGIYLINLIGSFFGLQIPQLFSSSLVGIGFSVAVCIIAALNFIMDFDFIEQGSQQMLGKNYEWYGAFGLMVTLVWLYVEILNLLAKMRDR